MPEKEKYNMGRGAPTARESGLAVTPSVTTQRVTQVPHVDIGREMANAAQEHALLVKKGQHALEEYESALQEKLKDYAKLSQQFTHHINNIRIANKLDSYQACARQAFEIAQSEYRRSGGEKPAVYDGVSGLAVVDVDAGDESGAGFRDNFQRYLSQLQESMSGGIQAIDDPKVLELLSSGYREINVALINDAARLEVQYLDTYSKREYEELKGRLFRDIDNGMSLEEAYAILTPAAQSLPEKNREKSIDNIKKGLAFYHLHRLAADDPIAAEHLLKTSSLFESLNENQRLQIHHIAKAARKHEESANQAAALKSQDSLALLEGTIQSQLLKKINDPKYTEAHYLSDVAADNFPEETKKWALRLIQDRDNRLVKEAIRTNELYQSMLRNGHYDFKSSAEADKLYDQIPIENYVDNAGNPPVHAVDENGMQLDDVYTNLFQNQVEHFKSRCDKPIPKLKENLMNAILFSTNMAEMSDAGLAYQNAKDSGSAILGRTTVADDACASLAALYATRAVPEDLETIREAMASIQNPDQYVSRFEGKDKKDIKEAVTAAWDEGKVVFDRDVRDLFEPAYRVGDTSTADMPRKRVSEAFESIFIATGGNKLLATKIAKLVASDMIGETDTCGIKMAGLRTMVCPPEKMCNVIVKDESMREVVTKYISQVYSGICGTVDGSKVIKFEEARPGSVADGGYNKCTIYDVDSNGKRSGEGVPGVYWIEYVGGQSNDSAYVIKYHKYKRFWGDIEDLKKSDGETVFYAGKEAIFKIGTALTAWRESR